MTSTPGHSGGAPRPPAAAAAKASSSLGRLARPEHEAPARRGRAAGTAPRRPAAAPGRAPRRTRTSSRSAPRPTSSERSACTCTATPISAAASRDERGLAGRRLDQMQSRAAGRTTASTRPGRPPPLPTSASGPGGAASTAGRPASASRTWRAAASAGSRIAVTPTGVAQTSATSSARLIELASRRARCARGDRRAGDLRRRFT